MRYDGQYPGVEDDCKHVEVRRRTTNEQPDIGNKGGAIDVHIHMGISPNLHIVEGLRGGHSRDRHIVTRLTTNGVRLTKERFTSALVEVSRIICEVRLSSATAGLPL